MSSRSLNIGSSLWITLLVCSATPAMPQTDSPAGRPTSTPTAARTATGRQPRRVSATATPHKQAADTITIGDADVHETSAPAERLADPRDMASAPVPTDIPLLKQAILEARKTVNTFITSLRTANPKTCQSAILMQFREGGNSEYLWVSNVTYDGTLFRGKVAKKPERLTGVRVGDPGTAAPDEIIDWMFTDGKTLTGGFTIRAMMMMQQQQQQPNRPR